MALRNVILFVVTRGKIDHFFAVLVSIAACLQSLIDGSAEIFLQIRCTLQKSLKLRAWKCEQRAQESEVADESVFRRFVQ